MNPIIRADVERALRASFPERAGEMIRQLEQSGVWRQLAVSTIACPTCERVWTVGMDPTTGNGPTLERAYPGDRDGCLLRCCRTMWWIPLPWSSIPERKS